MAYAWRGGTEMLLRHGEGAAITLLVLPALFEEANRMRRFTVSLMRSLASNAIGSVLPDLPGTGESLAPLAAVSLADWHEAVASLAADIRLQEGRLLTVAIRGGAILDGLADHGWRLAPEPGERILRDMVRATALTAGMKASDLDQRARAAPLSLSGNVLSPGLYAELHQAALPSGNYHTANLAGTRLWRAAEPGADPALVAAAAEDITAWIARCAA